MSRSIALRSSKQTVGITETRLPVYSSTNLNRSIQRRFRRTLVIDRNSRVANDINGRKQMEGKIENGQDVKKYF